MLPFSHQREILPGENTAPVMSSSSPSVSRTVTNGMEPEEGHDVKQRLEVVSGESVTVVSSHHTTASVSRERNRRQENDSPYGYLRTPSITSVNSRKRKPRRFKMKAQEEKKRRAHCKFHQPFVGSLVDYINVHSAQCRTCVTDPGTHNIIRGGQNIAANVNNNPDPDEVPFLLPAAMKDLYSVDLDLRPDSDKEEGV